MSTPDIRQRLEGANRTGEWADFTQNEVIPAEWIRELALADGHPKGLRVEGAVIQGRLDFEDCTLARPLLLSACSIAGGITLRRAKARMLGFQDSPEIGGIDGDGLEVSTYLFLRKSTINGVVNLLGAKIERDLDCDGAVFDGIKGVSLFADGLEVKGAVFLRGGFSSKGTIFLRDANLGSGGLSCRGAALDGDGGGALRADGLTVAGGLFLCAGFSAKGYIRLVKAKVGVNLECDGASFDGGDGVALQAAGLIVAGGVIIRGGFISKGRVDLNAASVGLLIDDAASWPEKGQLVLTGFTYDGIGMNSPQSAKQRLEWLRRREDMGRFDPQPYEQLAKVLKATGHDRDAREILVAKEKERLAKGGLPWYVWPFWWLYGLVSGFGYQRFRPLLWAIAIIALGAGIFDKGKSGNLMVPVKDRVYIGLDKTPPDPIPKDYPRLNPLMYSADLFLPFVDLAQDSYWMPSSTGKKGRMLTFYMWIHIALGWIVSALFVAGVTGLIKRE